MAKPLLTLVNPSLYRVKISVASSGERWALVVDQRGLAEEHTTLFATQCLRERGLSVNSQVARLQALAMLLSWADRRGIDLNARIGACDLLDRNEVADLRRTLRENLNVAKANTVAARKIVPPVVCHTTYYNRVHFVLEYVVWQADNVVQRVPTREHERAKEFRLRVDRFKVLVVANLPTPKSGGRESALPEERQALLDAIRPGSPNNPFRPDLQHRNQGIMLLYELLGLRRGEVLALRGEDLLLTGPKPSIDIVVRSDALDDPRVAAPRIKTLGRELPLDAALATILREYVLEHRTKLPGARRTPFVFLTLEGRPLSAQAVNDMYRRVRFRVPGVSPRMSPHMSRHDANEVFSDVAEEKGLSDAEELQLRNALFGWTKMSKQGERYNNRRTARKAGEASMRIQAKSFGLHL